MTEITLRKARTIIRKALEKGREIDLKPLSVVVVDGGGHVQAFEREDGAPAGRFQIAFGKAYGAVVIGVPSSKLVDMALERPHFVNALSGVYDGKIVPVAGGVLVRDKKGALIGAVGVTGDTSDNDAAAALAGIEAAGLIGEA
nr:heme-binding protein [Shimia gijangensis]